MHPHPLVLFTIGLSAIAASALAQTPAVFHNPSGGLPGGGLNPPNPFMGASTQRTPPTPREEEAVRIYFEVCCQFTYDRVAVYYTLDGSEPQGTQGVGQVGTLVLSNAAGSVNFVANDFNTPGQVRDWWVANFPAGTRQYGQTIRYKISRWVNGNPGSEVWNGGASNSASAPSIEFTNKLAWPGAGAGDANPGAGYPAVSFWKEEAIFGNTFTAGMLDQNGTVYDMHFPTVGGIYGVGTKNEGYVDGLDTFPPGLPQGWRGQMHLNQAMPGIRVDGLTHWLSNPNGVSFQNVEQSYNPTSNTVLTSQVLPLSGGGQIAVQQMDFAPYGVTFPTTPGNEPIRHIYVKRMRLTYTGPASGKDVNVYWYMDPALNGGDDHDMMFWDSSRGVMCAYDKTTRTVTGTGAFFPPGEEYNPTTDAGYFKNVALYLGAGMKSVPNGQESGPAAQDAWRDTSGDNGQGWIGRKVTLTPGVPFEVQFYMVGGHFRPEPITNPMPVADGVYDSQIAPAMEWLNGQNIAALMAQTDAAWEAWLNSGVTIDTPDDGYDDLMRRGLLATALHVDGVNGGVIAGFHNGAYPYVWPRDAAYAAVTLARTGHLEEAKRVFDWMRDTCFRPFEPWGRKGFWRQKYTTDGFVVWGAPQIDETSAFPWGVEFYANLTADSAFLAQNQDGVIDSVYSMTRDSSDGRLRYEEAFNLVYSNNVWEDSYDTFIYSNASVWQGLESARAILSRLGNATDAATGNLYRDLIKGGLDARLDWNGENTDISQLGIVYPFPVYNPTDSRVNLVVDRINGVATDTFGNNRPLINFSGEHQDTVNRYWGDGYWNGGPWFLSTLWYGLYYAERADHTTGNGDIDNHKYRIDLMMDRRGPAGMGAEQIAFSTGPGSSLLYPGQSDFLLQTAWPNAWESMSTFVDSIMAFLDYKADAWSQTMTFAPKLPSAWSEMTFSNVTMVHTPSGLTHKVDVRIEPETHTFTNVNGHPVTVRTVFRPREEGGCLAGIRVNGQSAPYTVDATGRILSGDIALSAGAGATTQVQLVYLPSADVNGDDGIDDLDIIAFFQAFEEGDLAVDFDASESLDDLDIILFFNAFELGCT